MEIVPAILTADKQDLKKKLAAVKTFAKKVQIDVADGVFVKNKTLAVSEFGVFEEGLAFEIHLMVSDPAASVAALESVLPGRSQGHLVIFHAEAVADAASVLQMIKKWGFKVGLAANPATPVKALTPFIDMADMILFLSVKPGFQGRLLVPSVLVKAADFKKKYPKKIVGLDGGITEENLKSAATTGVDEIVVGSAVWQAKNPKEEYNKLKALADS